MIKHSVIIINKLGLHARAAAKFVSLAAKFNCDVSLARSNRSVNGKSIMAVMLLAASKETELTITCDGENEQAAMDALIALINNRFDEAE